MKLRLAALAAAAAIAIAPLTAQPAASAAEQTVELKVSTFNASLNRDAEGQLLTDLSTPDNEQAKNAAETIQRAHPDVVLVNEFDYDEKHESANLFRSNYLEVPQNGADPVEYPYMWTGPVNTGVPSGFDLNNDGKVEGPDDALGFGKFPGQYGFVVYSKYPINEDSVRTFQNFKWKDMPGALLPENTDGTGWYSDEELEIMPLSSKTHADIPVDDVLDSFVAQAREHDHFSFLWYPHSTTALVKRNRRLREGEEAEGYAPQNAFSRFLDEALVQTWGRQVSAAVGTMAPSMVPKVNQFTATLMARKKFTDDSHQVFAQSHKVRFNELEYAVPLADGPEVVREIRALIERHDWRVSFPLEVRVTAADDIPLSPAYERESAYISVHRYVREPHDEYFGEMEAVLHAAGGRPHWGKLHTLGARELSALYPRFDEFVALRDEVDPERVFHNAYLDRVLGA